MPFENSEALIIKIIQFASGDPQKASLLATIKGTRIFIVFDYNNPDHLNDCKVLGFQVKLDHSVLDCHRIPRTRVRTLDFYRLFPP